MSRSQQLLLVFAGPNGSGKSTFIAQMIAGSRELPDISIPERILNPDEFARAIDPLNPDRARVNAARAVLRQRSALLAASVNFAVETTLSGKSEIRLLQEARRLAYRVIMVYIATENPRQNIIRIERRRAEQNRSVRPQDVLRRYTRSLEMVERAAKSCDEVYVFDNSRSEFIELLTIRHGDIESIKETTAWCELAFAASLVAFRSRAR